MKLKDMVGGALQQKFQNSFDRVMENMQDENTPYKDKRQITITTTFVQNEQRDDVVCDIAVKEKLAMQGGLKTHFSVAKDLKTGKVAAEEYGENNWQKGIPESSYIDSAVRHYLKWLRGDDDERHDRAFVWNIMCLIWTHEHITTNPEMPERSVFRDMTIRCVETDCYYNNDCICTAPPIFAVNGTAGKECFNYRED